MLVSLIQYWDLVKFDQSMAKRSFPDYSKLRYCVKTEANSVNTSYGKTSLSEPLTNLEMAFSSLFAYLGDVDRLFTPFYMTADPGTTGGIRGADLIPRYWTSTASALIEELSIHIGTTAVST
jgi:hypothetical protein